MKGVKIKIDDVKTGSSFEMTKLLLKIITITKNLYLSNTELHALTYFVTEGFNKVTRERLVENKLLKNKGSVANLVNTFRKYGIIVKNTFGEEINPEFVIPSEGLDIIKLELLVRK